MKDKSKTRLTVRKKGQIIKCIDSSTVKVIVVDKVLDSKYKKYVKKSKTYLVHSIYEHKVNDEIFIESIKPISKSKYWKSIKV